MPDSSQPYPDNPPAPAVRENRDLNGKTDTATKLSRSDRRFFNQAARLGEKEVALSRIATERATNPQVRALASEMVALSLCRTQFAGRLGLRGHGVQCARCRRA